MVVPSDYRCPFFDRWRSRHLVHRHGQSCFETRIEVHGHPARDSVAQCLYHLSIDKRSQLIDVGGGEMSLIGPRSAPRCELDLSEPEHLRRLQAAPEITRLWQAAARTIILFDEMVQLNVQDLQTWPFAGVLRLLAKTLRALLPEEGV
jgi:lipopolysaccharide/colanic/teichoic acid biosynthesis glycosyltransferase